MDFKKLEEDYYGSIINKGSKQRIEEIEDKFEALCDALGYGFEKVEPDNRKYKAVKQKKDG